MTMVPASGPSSGSQVNSISLGGNATAIVNGVKYNKSAEIELAPHYGNTTTGTLPISLNDSYVRTLAGVAATGSISFYQLYGKSSFATTTFNVVTVYQSNITTTSGGRDNQTTNYYYFFTASQWLEGPMGLGIPGATLASGLNGLNAYGQQGTNVLYFALSPNDNYGTENTTLNTSVSNYLNWYVAAGNTYVEPGAVSIGPISPIGTVFGVAPLTKVSAYTANTSHITVTPTLLGNVGANNMNVTESLNTGFAGIVPNAGNYGKALMGLGITPQGYQVYALYGNSIVFQYTADTAPLPTGSGVYTSNAVPVASTTATGASGQRILTVANTAGIAVGQLVQGTGILGGYVYSITGNQVQLNYTLNATASGTYKFYTAGGAGQYGEVQEQIDGTIQYNAQITLPLNITYPAGSLSGTLTFNNETIYAVWCSTAENNVNSIVSYSVYVSGYNLPSNFIIGISIGTTALVGTITQSPAIYGTVFTITLTAASSRLLVNGTTVTLQGVPYP